MSREDISRHIGEAETDSVVSAGPDSHATRRDFLQKTLVAASGLALSSVLPVVAEEPQTNPTTCTALPAGVPFQPITELTRKVPVDPKSPSTLKAVLKVLNENKTYLAKSAATAGNVCSNTGQMRFFAGYNRDNPSELWPPPSRKGTPTPGPTFRARVGDRVEITLLNQVNTNDFPNSLDVEEQGTGLGGCDVAKSTSESGASVNTYPGNPQFDLSPNCFHGSSTANLHFHGFHVSPAGIGDNILVATRPSLRNQQGQPIVDEAYLRANDFFKIFDDCAAGKMPMKWEDLPLEWRKAQRRLLDEYDKTAPYMGGHGLPAGQRLWKKDQDAIDEGRWPQYYLGAYPNCFTTPVTGQLPRSMGQAPGTHWYHAHKHGSTALNLQNGMAGAFILTGDYDDVLKKYISNPAAGEKVFVFQEIGTQINLLKNINATPLTDLVHTNGQLQPVLTMQPNEVQFWRFVNACHQRALATGGKPLTATPASGNPPGAALKWVQTAHDGVQLSQTNYDPNPANNVVNILAAGNRVDLLVAAPGQAGTYTIIGNGQTLFTVNVTGPALPVLAFPTQPQFPVQPPFLADITTAELSDTGQNLRFDSSPKVPGKIGDPPHHTINGRLFSGDVEIQVPVGEAQEWVISNVGPVNGPAHPFHIHVNPFQVVEIYDPTNSLIPKGTTQPVTLTSPVWWDVFPIPPAGPAKPGTGLPTDPGYIKIRSRFVDYTGMYVLHCHILGHEDRGMMQLVEVVPNTKKTHVTHH